MYDEVKRRPAFIVESILNPPPGIEAPASARVETLAAQPATAVAVQPRQSAPPSPRSDS